jgi:hypothetical protein
MQTLWADLHRDQRHRFLSDAQAEVVGGCSTDVAFLRLPTAGYLVAAFDLDERTVARWQRESGAQCRRVHEHLVEAGIRWPFYRCKPTRSGSRRWVGFTG